MVSGAATTEKGVMRQSGLPPGRQAGTWVLEGLCQIEGTWVITWDLVTGWEPACRKCAKIDG